MKKRLLFILSGNISTTPRALKVINLLKEEYECDIILINRSEVWLEKDKEILDALGLKTVILNLGRKPFIPWLFATIKEKISALIYPLFPENISIATCASNKSSIILWDHLRELRTFNNYDLILGHGAGALYPAWKLSKKWNIPFCFDVEDYHPGELIRKDALNEKKRRELLMRNLLPFASLITLSSPLIAQKTLELIGGNNNHLIILNSFSQAEFTMPEIKEGPLKMVWFSQKITYGRGLEMLLPAIRGLDANLTLIGSLDNNFYNNFLYDFKDIIKIKTPLSQLQLHKSLAEYDIGLAIEVSDKDINKQLALSNKILAYAQAGLYILATDTPAQKLFIEDEKRRGVLCEQSINSISQALNSIIKAKEAVRIETIDRCNRSKDFSWEKSGNQIKEKIQDIVG